MAKKKSEAELKYRRIARGIFKELQELDPAVKVTYDYHEDYEILGVTYTLNGVDYHVAFDELTIPTQEIIDRAVADDGAPEITSEKTFWEGFSKYWAAHYYGMLLAGQQKDKPVGGAGQTTYTPGDLVY